MERGGERKKKERGMEKRDKGGREVECGGVR